MSPTRNRSAERQEENRALLDDLKRTVDELGMGAGPRLRDGRGIRPWRRDDIGMTIVERDGVLLVGERVVLGRGRALRRPPPGVDVMDTIPLSRLGRNDVAAALAALDRVLTPDQGLRRLRDGELVPAARPPAKGRILLFVHGTFSHNDSLLRQIAAPGFAAGEEFLAWAGRGYDQVLAFDHPTLSHSPVLNARELDALFRGSKAHVDVVCHSRGGLVTRWWLEAFDRAVPERRRAVFVGSPLNGTGLASPPRLRGSISLMLNLSRVLGAASSAFLPVAAGLFRVISSITRFGARTPVIDAAVAIIPGIAAMSRVANNFELLGLRRTVDVEGRYFAVRSNFESEKTSWRFWKVFRDFGDKAKDTLTDVVFDGANDLVVDTPSMADFEDGLKLPRDQILDFGTSSEVHHTNYFEQKETLRFITESFG